MGRRLAVPLAELTVGPWVGVPASVRQSSEYFFSQPVLPAANRNTAHRAQLSLLYGRLTVQAVTKNPVMMGCPTELSWRGAASCTRPVQYGHLPGVAAILNMFHIRQLDGRSVAHGTKDQRF